MNTPTSPVNRSGFGTSQKKALGISAAALLLGGTAWAISQRHTSITDASGPEAPSVGPDSEAATLPSDIDVAGKVADSMSFEQAFAAAREEVGMGGVFGWHGHWYNTFEKDEWSSLSLEQRQEYTEMITGEKLPVNVYHPPVSNEPAPVSAISEPTAIEGHLNGQRVIGLDYDHDGVIDVLVMESTDGHIYKVVDATGDDGLDTVYSYDSLDGELTAVARLDQSVVLSNDQFSQGLEESMSKEVVDSILEPDASAPTPVAPVDEDTVDDADVDDADDDNHAHHPAASYDSDDTYVNNGDVHDMDE